MRAIYEQRLDVNPAYVNYYSDAYSKKRYIILSKQWFSLIVMKVSQRVDSSQFINEKMSLRKFVILMIIWVFLRHNRNLSKTSKILEFIISELRDQYPRYSGLFVYALLALARVQKDFLGIRRFLDNSGRSSYVT